MEAWGIIVMAFTLFGMLGLVIASVTMDEGATSVASLQPPSDAGAVAPALKEAA